MRSIHKEPLLHFLVLALGLFVWHNTVSHGDESDTRRIVVDEGELLTFIQFRTKSFEAVTARQQLDALSEEELQKVIDDYVHEEALYREARTLGLDRDDYVIKRRLIQKIDYIARGFAESIDKVSDEDIREYFEQHRADYYIAPRINFTHVFYSKDRHGEAGALTLAQQKLAVLNENGTDFNEAPRYGERFLYGMNYAERSEAFVESHFGTDMARELFALQPKQGAWQGPFMSPYGAHLVMVTRKQAGRMPLLAEVRSRVELDAQRTLTAERTRQATQQIVDSYDIDIVYEKPKQKLAHFGQ
jgi:hypothetical protein